jgi:hypothetical protein
MPTELLGAKENTVPLGRHCDGVSASKGREDRSGYTQQFFQERALESYPLAFGAKWV